MDLIFLRNDVSKSLSAIYVFLNHVSVGSSLNWTEFSVSNKGRPISARKLLIIDFSIPVAAERTDSGITGGKLASA